jgi:hypothetical protein
MNLKQLAFVFSVLLTVFCFCFVSTSIVKAQGIPVDKVVTLNQNDIDFIFALADLLRDSSNPEDEATVAAMDALMKKYKMPKDRMPLVMFKGRLALLYLDAEYDDPDAAKSFKPFKPNAKETKLINNRRPELLEALELIFDKLELVK